jgi:hypothetical protein
MRNRLRDAAALVTLLAGSAGASPLLGPGVEGRLAAGRVEVLALGPATAGAEERELVLSLDGGRSFPVRLTGEIGPGDGVVSWRVPALFAEHVVLALREGGGGLEERIVTASAEFAIVPGPGVPAEALRFRDGEWKTREADSGPDSLPTSALGSPGPGRWTPLDDARDCFEEPARVLPAGPGALAVPERSPAWVPFHDGSRSVLCLPSFLPLRE